MPREKDSKTIWLEEGLKILTTKGPAALSIESLTFATGKTKGSFYHHFSNREQYIDALLEYHEKNSTDEIIEVISQGADSHTRIKKLTKLTFQTSGDLELAIRAWALYDPKVRAFQDHLDRRRLEYLKTLHIESGMAADKAKILVYRNYSLFIGLQQLKRYHNKNEFRRILRNVFAFSV